MEMGRGSNGDILRLSCAEFTLTRELKRRPSGETQVWSRCRPVGSAARRFEIRRHPLPTSGHGTPCAFVSSTSSPTVRLAPEAGTPPPPALHLAPPPVLGVCLMPPTPLPFWLPPLAPLAPFVAAGTLSVTPADEVCARPLVPSARSRGGGGGGSDVRIIRSASSVSGPGSGGRQREALAAACTASAGSTN